MKFSQAQVKQALGEVQTLLRWTFNITNPPQGLTFPEKLMIRVTTTGLPKAEVERTVVELGGHTINYNGKTKKAGQLTVTFVEGVDASVTEFIYQWMQKQWGSDGKDTTGKQSKTAEVKADIQIQLLDGNDVATQTYNLIGCLPSIGDAGGELGQTADPMKPQLTLDYDDFHFGVGTSVTI